MRLCNSQRSKTTPTSYLPALIAYARNHEVRELQCIVSPEKRRVGLCLLSLPFSTPLLHCKCYFGAERMASILCIFYITVISYMSENLMSEWLGTIILQPRTGRHHYYQLDTFPQICISRQRTGRNAWMHAWKLCIWEEKSQGHYQPKKLLQEIDCSCLVVGKAAWCLCLA